MSSAPGMIWEDFCVVMLEAGRDDEDDDDGGDLVCLIIYPWSLEAGGCNVIHASQAGRWGELSWPTGAAETEIV